MTFLITTTGDINTSYYRKSLKSIIERFLIITYKSFKSPIWLLIFNGRDMLICALLLYQLALRVDIRAIMNPREMAYVFKN